MLMKKSYEDYTSLVEDWGSNNHKIITWFRNTLEQSIGMEFKSYETCKELQNVLTFWYPKLGEDIWYQMIPY